MLSCFYKHPMALSLFEELLLNFLSIFYIPPLEGKFFKFMEFTLKMYWLEAFVLMSVTTKDSPPSSCHNLLSMKKLLIPQAAFFRKSVSPNCRNGWKKLWFALSKFSQKIWRWPGTLGFSYFVWFAIFSNVMALQFCK